MAMIDGFFLERSFFLFLSLAEIFFFNEHACGFVVCLRRNLFSLKVVSLWMDGWTDWKEEGRRRRREEMLWKWEIMNAMR